MVRIPFKHVMVPLEIFVLNNSRVFLMTEKQTKNRIRNGPKQQHQKNFFNRTNNSLLIAIRIFNPLDSRGGRYSPTTVKIKREIGCGYNQLTFHINIHVMHGNVSQISFRIRRQ